MTGCNDIAVKKMTDLISHPIHYTERLFSMKKGQQKKSRRSPSQNINIEFLARYINVQDPSMCFLFSLLFQTPMLLFSQWNSKENFEAYAIFEAIHVGQCIAMLFLYSDLFSILCLCIIFCIFIYIYLSIYVAFLELDSLWLCGENPWRNYSDLSFCVQQCSAIFGVYECE